MNSQLALWNAFGLFEPWFVLERAAKVRGAKQKIMMLGLIIEEQFITADIVIFCERLEFGELI